MKSIITTLIFLSVFIFSSQQSFAEGDFDITAKNVYTISRDGQTTVTQNISILNNEEFIYTPSYTVSLGIADVRNIQVYNTAGSVPFDYKKKDDSTILTINFHSPPKGKGKINFFTVKFQSDELVTKKGDVFELVVPGIINPDTFDRYENEVIFPASFPQPKIVKPSVPVNKNTLTFTKDDTTEEGIVIVFGDIQYYALNLKYNVTNPNLFPIKTEIALPPNTNYQESLIEKIDPSPDNVYQDTDGNWIAVYSLLPREKKSVGAKVTIKLNHTPLKEDISAGDKKLYTESKSFWETNDPKIKEAASALKTPSDIYEFVVNTLTYDYDKASSANTRLGAREVLSGQKSGVCLEFADLFVALARAKGIPSGTIEGYAYTSNSTLRPLSLVADVLHAWPEYYDSEMQSWVMVDPTWGNTTSGTDYFNTMDLDHIAFVVKGADSTYPIPAGGYKTQNGVSRDIDVEFATAERFRKKEKILIEHSFPPFSLSGLPISGRITITNIGNSIMTDETIKIVNEATGEQKNYLIENLPPYGKETFVADFKTTFLTKGSHNIKIQHDNEQTDARVYVSIVPNYSFIMIGGGIFAATGFITFASYKTWRIHIQRSKRQDNLHRKSKKS